MTKKAIVLMATGFEEMELTISVDILRRAEIDVKTVSLKEDKEPIKGSRGIYMVPDLTINNVNIEELDLVILPGGLEGTQNLGESKSVRELIIGMAKEGKKIAAICAAPVVLAMAGLLKNQPATSHPAAKNHMRDVDYKEDRVVVNGNIITSRAAGTTFEFAFKIVEELLGKEKADEVNVGVLAKL